MAQCLGSRFERSGALVLANWRGGGGQPRVLSGLGKCPTREQTLKKFFMITIIIVITSVNPKTLQNDPFILCIVYYGIKGLSQNIRITDVYPLISYHRIKGLS